jgi:uncharacterized protein YodC (DUF2158 family)
MAIYIRKKGQRIKVRKASFNTIGTKLGEFGKGHKVQLKAGGPIYIITYQMPSSTYLRQIKTGKEYKVSKSTTVYRWDFF